METASPYLFSKDSFDVTLSKTDTELKIDAKNQQNKNTFSENFSIGTIKTMTNGLFEDIPEFFEALLTAFDGQSDETSISIDKEAKLHFTQKMRFGKSEKIFALTIPLKAPNEKEDDEEEPSGTLEELIKKLFKEVRSLKKENSQLKEKLGCSDYEMISPNFDVYGFNACLFSINKTKSVARNKTDAGQPYQISSTEKLSRSKNMKFQVRIESLGQSIIIGVAIKSLISHRYWFNQDGAYCMVSDNEVRTNGDEGVHWTNCSKLMRGSIVGVLLNPGKGEVEFDVNGRHVYTAKVKQAHLIFDFYPIVSLSSCDDCVTFLETSDE